MPTINHSQAVFEGTIAAHKLLEEKNIDIVMFYENASNSFISQNFGTAHISYAYSFDGVLISTDAHCARRSLEVVTSQRKIYYPYNIDWKLNPPLSYPYLVDIYRNIEVVARSESHKKAIDNAFNLSVRVVKNFDLEHIIWGNQIIE